MNTTFWLTGLRLGLAVLALSWMPASGQTLTLVRKIELPGVQGRIDHLAIDEQGGRLFVAALGSDSLEVVDLRAGKREGRITSLHEPQGVLYIAASKHVIVANGSGGGVQAFADGRPPAVAVQPDLDDADNLRWDAAAGTTYVGFGSALAELDGSLRVKRRFELAGHPESFQIEQAGRRIFVNVPRAGHVAVVNRDSGKVEATWVLNDAASNYAMALDEAGHRLFIATRTPALLLTYDTQSGRRVARTPTCGDADELFFDQAAKQLYVVCGEGRVDVARPKGDSYVVAARVSTSTGARTGLFVPGLAALFVAAPARGGASAHVLEFQVR